MAIISCPECQTDVSDSALKCPKCGVQLRKAKRSFFGKIIKWTFVGFNILMLVWLVAGMNNATSGMDNMTNAEQAGAAIGTSIGAMLILTVWFFGSIILGLFVLLTRPKA